MHTFTHLKRPWGRGWATIALPADSIRLGFVNGATIFLKSGAAKFPSLAGLGDQPLA
jgi:hypothetical protein